MSEVKQAFIIDGKIFDTKAEALDYVRRPKIKAALFPLTKDEELTEWLINNQDAVSDSFETGTIRRVSKGDKAKLEKALNAIENVSGAEFVYENRQAVMDSFRWPTQKRLNDEEKNEAIRTALSAIPETNEQLVQWIMDNRAEVLAAYEAGIEKRPPSEKAMDALAAYRARKAAEKAAAAEAAE